MSASLAPEGQQRVDCRSSTESIERQLNAAEPPPIAIDRTALTGQEQPLVGGAQFTL